jgi:hypothetical protein
MLTIIFLTALSGWTYDGFVTDPTKETRNPTRTSSFERRDADFESGARPDATPSGTTGSRPISNAASLPLPYNPAELPCDLATVVAAWSELPEPIRAGIMAMVKAAQKA